MDNQQDYILNNEQKQVLLTGTFGDGHISDKYKESYFISTTIHSEYAHFKASLLDDLHSKTSVRQNNGYKKGSINVVTTTTNKAISRLYNLSLQEKLNELDKLGLAMWFYDDGSLHKKNLFYNLNTHAFSKEEHEIFLKPYFEELGLRPKILLDKKKDSREFSYLYFGKYDGAYEITTMLEDYKLDCFKYKRWSPETIQKWSRVQAYSKSENITLSRRKFGDLMKVM